MNRAQLRWSSYGCGEGRRNSTDLCAARWNCIEYAGKAPRGKRNESIGSEWNRNGNASKRADAATELTCVATKRNCTDETRLNRNGVDELRLSRNGTDVTSSNRKRWAKNTFAPTGNGKDRLGNQSTRTGEAGPAAQKRRFGKAEQEREWTRNGKGLRSCEKEWRGTVQRCAGSDKRSGSSICKGTDLRGFEARETDRKGEDMQAPDEQRNRTALIRRDKRRNRRAGKTTMRSG